MASLEELLPELDFVDNDGIRRASMTFSITLFTPATFAQFPQAALRCQQLFFELCPPERIRYYATENMRKHRAVNKKVLGMLELWSKNPETKTEYVSLELKDGNSELDAPKFLFKLDSAEEGSPAFEAKHSNSITLSFPPEFGIERGDELLALTRRLFEILPWTSGCAGFAYQCSRYTPRLGESFAWQKSMRHPEADIVRMPQDNRAAKQNALKTIGWLTLVCDAFVAELGGIDAITKGLGKGVSVLPVKGGVLFRIGDGPVLSDRNRGETNPDYKKLYMALRPLIERAHDQAMWFTTDSDDQAGQCEAWYKRFER